MQIVLGTILKAVLTYILLLFLTRVMGRKLIAQMTFFDFVIAISLGTAGATISLSQGNDALTAAITTVVFAILAIASAYINIKSFSARKVINSEPVTLVENGNIVEPNMKNIRMSINELMMKLREKNVFNLVDVEFAIMETDGQLSVLPKPEKQPLTPSHMNVQTTSKGLLRDIIIDGNVMEENLTAFQLDMNWLNTQLKGKGIKEPSEVFYAGVDNSKTLYISKKTSGKEKEGMYGIE